MDLAFLPPVSIPHLGIRRLMRVNSPNAIGGSLCRAKEDAMTVRDELIARLYEDLDDIRGWLAAYDNGATTGRMHQGVWEDTTAMDKEAYERLKRNIHDSIQHLEEQKKPAASRKSDG
jgi:hypothetical protein